MRKLAQRQTAGTGMKRMGRALAGISAGVVVLVMGFGCAQETAQTTYVSPDEATKALVSAMRSNDQAEMKKVLGEKSGELITSGDPVEDKQRGERFVNAYDEKHALENTSTDYVTLVVGKNDWPLPIPIVKSEETGKWYFDTEAGKEEILNRWIGQNELNVIQVCKTIVDAQKEYASRNPMGDGVPQYARKFISDPGTKDGLYWKTAEGEEPSPLGELVGDAVEEGYKPKESASAEPRPFHGYYYRMLLAQGPGAPGGAMDYVVKGRLIGGFAVVAYPATYGTSGIMTFMVNHTGVIYQKDLGEQTEKIARGMTTFDPGPDWKAVQDGGKEEGAADKQK